MLKDQTQKKTRTLLFPDLTIFIVGARADPLRKVHLIRLGRT